MLFWVRWRHLFTVRWLLANGRLAHHEESFLRAARDILRRRRRLTPRQYAWLYALYDRTLVRSSLLAPRLRSTRPARARRVTSVAEQLPQPPVLGEALLALFCPKNRARHVMGCLEEIFHEDIKTKGKRRAKLLYWAAVLHSIGPLLCVKVRKAGLIALLLEIGRRWSGMS